MVCPLLPLSVWVRAIAGRHSTKNQILKKKKNPRFYPSGTPRKKSISLKIKFGVCCHRFALEISKPQDQRTTRPQNQRTTGVRKQNVEALFS